MGSLRRGRTGRFAKTIFYFLRADTHNSCKVTIEGKSINLGDGDGMQVPCTPKFSGHEQYVNFLQNELHKLD